MCVLHQGYGIGLFDFSVPVIRIPCVQVTAGAYFCFFNWSANHGFFEGDPELGAMGATKESVGLCLQESYSLIGEISLYT